MAFRVFNFHFDPALDATGFVGWLHSHLARTTGTGHVVVCGRSARGPADLARGAIFEPWHPSYSAPARQSGRSRSASASRPESRDASSDGGDGGAGGAPAR